MGLGCIHAAVFQGHHLRLMEFFIDSVEVDVMAGFAIVKDGKVYDCALRKE